LLSKILTKNARSFEDLVFSVFIRFRASVAKDADFIHDDGKFISGTIHVQKKINAQARLQRQPLKKRVILMHKKCYRFSRQLLPIE
jgi:hypothetical protein